MKLELFRILDDEGRVLRADRMPAADRGQLRRAYEFMWLSRFVDERMLRLQRQGRIGFTVTATGEEAAIVGAAWGLEPRDWVYSCYREVAVAFFRGYSLRTYLCQMFGNAEDPVKGRQMPVHHTVKDLNFVSVSSPVGTQIPQAVGTAMAARMSGRDDVALTFFGDGATSTGAFHIGCNFAAVRKAPVIFLCRNNGWAISSPRTVQTVTPTFAQKAIAYGMPGVLVDGNDVLAVAQAVREAAARARRGEGPTLIEARTYRRGPHSTSDDPSVYRDPEEPRLWEGRDPLIRYRKFLMNAGHWTEADDQRLQAEYDQSFNAALAAAEAVGPPDHGTLFDDVFAQRTWNLEEQHRDLLRLQRQVP